MIRICITLILGCLSLSAFAQFDRDSLQNAGKKLVEIINSDELMGERIGESDVQILIGNVHLIHEGTHFYCDSAVLDETANRFQAFKNVRADMPDNVKMSCQKMIYDGNTKIADGYEQIRLSDAGSVLTTNRIVYDRNINMGKYVNGGKLVSSDNTLTSEIGYYYMDSKMAYFRKNVDLVNPDYTLKSDTLIYNTQTKIAEFVTLTHIKSKEQSFSTTKGSYDTRNKKLISEERSTMQDGNSTLDADQTTFDDSTHIGVAIGNVIFKDSATTLYCDKVIFNKETNDAEAFGKVKLVDKDFTLYADKSKFNKETGEGNAVGQVLLDDEKYVLQADSAEFNRETGFSRSWGNVFVKQKDSTLNVMGDYGEFDRKKNSSLVTQNPMAIQVIDRDTVYIVADTLFAAEDSVTKKRMFRAWNHVQMYMDKLQTRADSMIYSGRDSMIKLFQSPILWSDSSQLTGDTIFVFLKNDKIDSLWVHSNSFLVSLADTVGYDQIKGEELRAKFAENKIQQLHVIGKAESIYYLEEGNKGYQGMNQSISREMFVYFKDNKAAKIRFVSKPEGTYKPIHEVIFQEIKLEGMNWRPGERPVKPEIRFVY